MLFLFYDDFISIMAILVAKLYLLVVIYIWYLLNHIFIVWLHSCVEKNKVYNIVGKNLKVRFILSLIIINGSVLEGRSMVSTNQFFFSSLWQSQFIVIYNFYAFSYPNFCCHASWPCASAFSSLHLSSRVSHLYLHFFSNHLCPSTLPSTTSCRRHSFSRMCPMQFPFFLESFFFTHNFKHILTVT